MEYSRRGARVLALAIKFFGILSHQQVRELKREDVESKLVFAGFVIISCPIKPDTKNVIKELIYASHKVMMITGDNPLTACHVAKELRFTRKPSVILTCNLSKKWEWLSIDGSKRFKCKTPIKELLSNFDLCLTGEGLQYIKEYYYDYMLTLLPYVTVCARFAPQQKEYIITTLKSLGYCTLMCGDGTNDVGALKHANVGVSLLSKTPSKKLKSFPSSSTSANNLTTVNESILHRTNAGNSNINTSVTQNLTTQLSASSSSSIRSSSTLSNINSRNSRIVQRREAAMNSQARLQSMLREMDDEQISVVKLGDASIAAPFTSKSSSISCGKFNVIIKILLMFLSLYIKWLTTLNNIYVINYQLCTKCIKIFYLFSESYN